MEASLGRWISIIHRYGQSYLEKQFGGLDVGYGHIAFIRALSRRDSLSQEELSEVLSIDKTTTARAIKTLVELGYVARSPDSTDRRIYRLSLTAKAKAITPLIKESLRTLSEVLSSGLSENERQLVLGLLKRMAENAKEFKENGFVQIGDEESIRS
jgi:DNA-binding MarR family transcriptional regulator